LTLYIQSIELHIYITIGDKYQSNELNFAITKFNYVITNASFTIIILRVVMINFLSISLNN